MDPVSQCVVGAVASQNVVKKKDLGVAALVGGLSAMVPDLDVLIHSSTDPLLFLEYHRQFTHSLIFIPFGGLICALILYWVFARKYFSFWKTYLLSTVGYATHGLLDSCTSYGTQLFWPFDNHRVAWSNISIIDPLFTLPVLFFILAAVIKKNRLWSRLALLWMMGYLLLGVVQNMRAEMLGRELAASRNHQLIRLEAKPGFGNLLLWKVIYETKDHFYVDGVRVGLQNKVYPGTAVAKLNVEKDLPWLDKDSQQAKDIERFRWFSQGYIAADPKNPNSIGDIRYSAIPNEIEPLWMLKVNPHAAPDEHAEYIHRHVRPAAQVQTFLDMLFANP